MSSAKYLHKIKKQSNIIWPQIFVWNACEEIDKTSLS